jgi:5-methylcytosine-specific restriction endonuclease McrA
MAFSKCALCESAGPGTVEHLEEKSKTPARAFDWKNLLPACDHCNRSRQNTGIASQPLDPSDPLV